MIRATVMLALVCVFIAGCEKTPAEKIKAHAEDAKEQVKESADNVWSGTVQTIDKAKGVGKTLMDSAEEQRRRIDKESE